MAKECGVNDYPCPVGGCKLTDKNFAEKLRDYFDYNDVYKLEDMAILKVVSHFRLENGEKLVLARNESEGSTLERIAKPNQTLIIPQFSASVAVLEGELVKDAFSKILEYTNRKIEGDPQIEILCAGSVKILNYSELVN